MASTATRPEVSTITANLGGQVQRVTGEDGRSYLVAPVSMLNPGVLAGSKGPLLYRPQDVKQSVPYWDGMPITHYHPTDPLTNEHLSANDDGVWDRQGLGNVRAPRFNRKLQGEAWFDEERTANLAPDVYAALINEQPMEVSTGLYTENRPQAGSFKGRPYEAVATNYRPDHLAILPTQVGACSIQDGCGLLVNRATSCSCGGSCEKCRTTNVARTGDLTKVDFVKLPPSVTGTNCGNCKYSHNSTCTYHDASVDLRGTPVTPQHCCAKWDAVGTQRPRDSVLNALTTNAVGCPEFFATLLHAATAAHLLHFATRSYAAHKALEGLYTALPTLVDTLVESYQGRNDLIDAYPSGFTPPQGDPRTFVAGLLDYVDENRACVGKDSELQNLVDEITGLLSQTLYRLRFLTEK